MNQNPENLKILLAAGNQSVHLVRFEDLNSSILRISVEGLLVTSQRFSKSLSV